MLFFIQHKLIVTNKVEMNQYFFFFLLILIIIQMFVYNSVAHKAHKTVCHATFKRVKMEFNVWICDKTEQNLKDEALIYQK